MKEITIPITLNYEEDNVIGEVRINKKYEKLLWNMHLAPGFIVKKLDTNGLPIKTEIIQFALQNDSQFTNWKGEKFLPESQVNFSLTKLNR